MFACLPGSRASAAIATRAIALASRLHACSTACSVVVFLLNSVQQDWCALFYASDLLKADRQVVLAAVQKNGNALEYAAGCIRADVGVVLAAVKRSGIMALGYATRTLQDDTYLQRVVVCAARQGLT